MSRASLSSPTLPALAIAHKATAPNPGKPYALAYSTIENDVVVWNGVMWCVAGRCVTPYLYALSNLGAANYAITAGTGGEKGSASPWCGFVMFDPRVASTNLRRICGSWVGSSGWTLDLLASGALQLSMADGSGTTYKSATISSFLPIDFGRVCVAFFGWDGTTLRLELGRGLLAATVAMTAMVPITATSVGEGVSNNGEGASGSGTNFSGGSWYAMATFSGAPTLTQRQAYWDAARKASDLPAALGGCTPRHRRSLRDALAGQSVVDGQTAPDSMADTVTGASVDALARVGTPTVRAIDASTEGRKSYGVIGAGAGNFYQTAVGAGLIGQSAGFSIALRATLDSLAASTKGYLVAQHTGSNAGFYVSLANAGAGTLRFAVANGSPAMVFAGVTLTAADVGVPILLECEHDGTTLRVRINGVERATQPITGYTQITTTSFGVGGAPTNNYPLEGATVWQVATGNGALTAGERSAIAASFASTGLLVPVAGKHAHHWNPTLDAAADVTTAPATLVDRIGVNNLSRAGTGTQVARRSERLWSYEASPITQGMLPAVGAHLQSANAFSDIGGAPCWVAMVYKPLAQTGVNSIQILASSFVASTAPGIQLYTGATNGTINFSMLGAAGAGFTNTFANIGLSDLGRMDLILGVYTGTQLLLYRKRALASSVSAVFTAAAPTGQFYLGSEYSTGTARAANGCNIYGFAAGLGVPTLAQYQAWFDWVNDEDGNIQAIPGMTAPAHLYRIPDGGGVAPAVVSDLGSNANTLNRVGSPASAPNYVRAIAA